MKKNSLPKFILLVIAIVVTVASQAQPLHADSINPYRVVVRSSQHGISLLNNLDTYLSGYNHTGTGYTFTHETLRKAHFGSYDFKYQTLLHATLGYTNLHDNNQYSLMAGRRWSGYHPFRVNDRLELLAGAQVLLSGGALYVPTNGNNLVSLKMHLAVAGTAMAIYHLPLVRNHCTLRYQIDIPLAGLLFSPEFGQSYYEIFGLEDYGGTLRFSHPVNTPSWRHTLSADIPIGNSTIRVSYVADLYQTKVNNLRTHLYNHSFSVGFVRTIYKVKRNDPLNVYNPF